MARAHHSAPHSLPSSSPVTLLYIKGEDEELSVLDRAIHVIVERYAPHVDLQVVAPGDVPADLAQWAERTPTVLVVRHGTVVGEAVGAFLPTREIDRVVRCAVEWAR